MSAQQEHNKYSEYFVIRWKKTFHVALSGKYLKELSVIFNVNEINVNVNLNLAKLLVSF